MNVIWKFGIGNDPSNIYAIQVFSVFLTTARAYGIYDSEYHVIAIDWITMNTNARPPFFSCNQKNKNLINKW